MDAIYELLTDLYQTCERQGPGGDEETRLAMRLAGLDRSRPLNVADIGCGAGAAALLLAEELDATVTAVDFLPGFLERLRRRARARGVADRVRPLHASMTDLPFQDEAFDVLWAEGSIYNTGFEDGIREWRRFLKPGGKLVVSEMTWLGGRPPQEIRDYWEEEYPEIAPAFVKTAQLERHGYALKGYFVLPESCWRENYYLPLQRAFAGFLERQGDSPAARALVDAERQEIALYERYGAFYGYGFYIAEKID